jgi:hypothetical protein
MSRDTNLSVIDADGNTVLHELISQELADVHLKSVLVIAPELLNCDCDDPILLAAIVHGTPAAVSALLQCGADFTVTDDLDSDALTWATFEESSKHLEKLKILLSHQKQKPSSNQGNEIRLHIALGEACIPGNSGAVRLLSEFGVDPNYYIPETYFGAKFTPFSLACLRRTYFAKNDHPMIKIQATYEEGIKFVRVQELLHEKELDETRRYPPLNMTAEEMGILSEQNLLHLNQVMGGVMRGYICSDMPK